MKTTTPLGGPIEFFALLSTQENWLLVAWCRLRNAFRHFCLARIKKLQLLEERLRPHNMSLQAYFDSQH